MAQNRKPPAYQEYAATTLADRYFRLMSLAERGLYHSMRLECWQNGNVPGNPNELAKYLGYEPVEIIRCLTANVLHFFLRDGENLLSPEIEDYRNYLDDRKKKQSEGGKKGANTTNSKYKPSSNYSQLARRDTRESLVKSSLEKHSQTQSIDNESSSVNAEWIDAYDRESNGG